MSQYFPFVLLFTGVLIGIWLNRRDFIDLKADMARQFDSFKADTNRQFDSVSLRLGRIGEDQKRFHKSTGVLYGRIDELSARVK